MKLDWQHIRNNENFDVIIGRRHITAIIQCNPLSGCQFNFLEIVISGLKHYDLH